MGDRKTSLQLRRWDPRTSLKKTANIIILGHKHTGKSTLIMDIIYNLHSVGYPRIVVFSGTEEGNGFFTRTIPKAYIHHGLDLDDLKSIVESQRQIIMNKRKAEKELGRPLDLDTRLIIVLDDIMYKRGVTRTEVFGEIAMNGRHWEITMMLTCQYVMLLDTAVRSNIDYLICLRELIPRNRLRIYDNFFGMFSKRQDFYTVLDQCTQNYEALVLDNTQPQSDPEKCVFWYKAEYNLPEFKFGSKAFRKFGEDNTGKG